MEVIQGDQNQPTIRPTFHTVQMKVQMRATRKILMLRSMEARVMAAVCSAGRAIRQGKWRGRR